MVQVLKSRGLVAALGLLLCGCGELWVPSGHATSTFALNCNHSELACESCHAPNTDPTLTDPACISCHEETRPASHDPAKTDTCDACHSGCGWSDDVAPHTLSCAHTGVSCESCHTPGSEAPTDPACVSCHQSDRPASHDPSTTATCETCHAGCEWGATGGFHPDGFVQGIAHGQAMKLQDATTGDCRDCHGADLTGGDAIGCDSCHDNSGIPNWRTDCVLCHGGESDNTGAPPLDIDNTSNPNDISAPSHPAHAVPDTHADIPCESCHDAMSRALDPGHIFDQTPGRAEVNLLNALGGGSYDGNGSCSDSYCHGNGRSNGSVSEGDANTCSACHKGPNSGNWNAMSGEHDRHMSSDSKCVDCHSTVVDANNNIIGASRHVDGVVNVVMDPSTGITYNGNTCGGGRCHGEEHSHSGDRWTEN